MSFTGAVRDYEIPNCVCGPPLMDLAGRVVRVKTCPRCHEVRLAVIRGVTYAVACVRDGDGTKRVLLKQLDLFSL